MASAAFSSQSEVMNHSYLKALRSQVYLRSQYGEVLNMQDGATWPVKHEEKSSNWYMLVMSYHWSVWYNITDVLHIGWGDTEKTWLHSCRRRRTAAAAWDDYRSWRMLAHCCWCCLFSVFYDGQTTHQMLLVMCNLDGSCDRFCENNVWIVHFYHFLQADTHSLLT